MKDIYCARHECLCDLGMWYGRIDWKLFDKQVKTLAQVQHRMESQPGEYGTPTEAEHLEGLYNMLADLWDMKPETKGDTHEDDPLGHLARK